VSCRRWLSWWSWNPLIRTCKARIFGPWASGFGSHYRTPSSLRKFAQWSHSTLRQPRQLHNFAKDFGGFVVLNQWDGAIRMGWLVGGQQRQNGQSRYLPSWWGESNAPILGDIRGVFWPLVDELIPTRTVGCTGRRYPNGGIFRTLQPMPRRFGHSERSCLLFWRWFFRAGGVRLLNWRLSKSLKWW